MKVITTAQEIITKIEESKSGFPTEILIAESLITVEKNGHQVKFRLREVEPQAKKQHIDIMKTVTGDKKYSAKQQSELDNHGRPFTLEDLSAEEFGELNELCEEIRNHFTK